MLLMLMFPVLSSSNRSKIRLIPAWIRIWITLVYLSPSLEVMASKNYSKSIYLPSDSKSAIMLKIVGFFDSKPRLCMADFNYLNKWYKYLGSILPVASVSNKLKAYFNSSISSAVSPGLYVVFLAGPLDAAGFAPLIYEIKFISNQLYSFHIYNQYQIILFLRKPCSSINLPILF